LLDRFFNTPPGEPLGEIVSRALRTGPSAAPSHIPALDGLRGVAVLFVIVSHLSNHGAHLIPGVNLSGVGKVGVWLFFVLSSFLLTSQMIGRDDSALRRSRTWFNYALRRVLRIFPLYTLVVAICFFSWTKYFPRFTAQEALAHLTLRAGKRFFWTIPVEFKFYFALPLLVLAFVFLLRRNTVSISAVVVSALALLKLFPPPSQTISLARYFPIFLLGSLAAVVQREIELRPARITSGTRIACELAAVATFVVIVVLTPSLWSAVIGRRIPTDHFHEYFLLFGTLWASFLLCQLNGHGLVRRILSSAPLRFIGIVSFSLYLWHQPVIGFMFREHVGSPSLQGALALCVALAVAALSYLVIERPFLRIGSRPRTEISRNTKPRGGETLARDSAQAPSVTQGVGTLRH
jgi:peptidoglycan/LPS O-acetylase OafA/YrhL